MEQLTLTFRRDDVYGYIVLDQDGIAGAGGRLQGALNDYLLKLARVAPDSPWLQAAPAAILG